MSGSLKAASIKNHTEATFWLPVAEREASVAYSYRNATIGSTRDARRAGR